MSQLVLDAVQRVADLCDVEVKRLDTEDGVLEALGNIANAIFQLKGQLEKIASQRNEARRDVQKVLSIAAQLQRKEMVVPGVVGEPKTVPVAEDGGPDESDMYDYDGMY